MFVKGYWDDGGPCSVCEGSESLPIKGLTVCVWSFWILFIDLYVKWFRLPIRGYPFYKKVKFRGVGIEISEQLFLFTCIVLQIYQQS